MAAIIGAGQIEWGLQLPVQSQSTPVVQPWEIDAGVDGARPVGASADRAGAFYVAVCDHVGVPRPADEAMSAVWYDTVATLGWVAGLTESVHLFSHVYVLPYRHPLTMAKAFMTLDHLRVGRAILGAGAGHLARSSRCSASTTPSRRAGVEAAIPLIRSAFVEEYPTSVGGAPRSASACRLGRPGRAAHRSGSAGRRRPRSDGPRHCSVTGGCRRALPRSAPPQRSLGSAGRGRSPGCPRRSTSASWPSGVRRRAGRRGRAVRHDRATRAASGAAAAVHRQGHEPAAAGVPRPRRGPGRRPDRALRCRGRPAARRLRRARPPLPPAGRFRRADRSPHRRRGPGRSAARRIGGMSS